ncbi:hypothetical protein ACRW9N_13190 [Listeria aquatica]|uniref:hypothetical protein n=1 Tax=Listeria aquatica TaxID=1494960 RepID=UPI003EF0CED9
MNILTKVANFLLVWLVAFILFFIFLFTICWIGSVFSMIATMPIVLISVTSAVLSLLIAILTLEGDD